MLNRIEIVDKVFSSLDKSLFESLFMKINENGIAEVSSWMVGSVFILIYVLIFLFLERNNGYTPGYWSRRNASSYFSLFLSAILIFFLFPKDLGVREERLTDLAGPKIIQLTIEEISKETDPQTKMDMMTKYTDKSGKFYYYKFKEYSEESESTSDGYTNIKPNKHYYVGQNFQDEYVKCLKDLENNYKEQKIKDFDLAIYLSDIFEEGNQFINKNRKKHNFYENEKSKISKSLEPKSIKKVNV